MTPRAVAEAAVTHEQPAARPGDKVKLTVDLYLDRAQAERLTEAAIRAGRNLDALVTGIVERHLHGPRPTPAGER